MYKKEVVIVQIEDGDILIKTDTLSGEQTIIMYSEDPISIEDFNENLETFINNYNKRNLLEE